MGQRLRRIGIRPCADELRDELSDLVRVGTVAFHESRCVLAHDLLAILGGIVSADHSFDVPAAGCFRAVPVKVIEDVVGQLLPDRAERRELPAHKAYERDSVAG